ncbi:MAG: spore maturation protein [Clostridia bacterium]|nr:spore maturation protein [Clostridia bacterium]
MTAAYYLLPILFTCFGMLLFFSKHPLYDDFVTGAREGIESAVKLIPTLILLLCTVSFFGASGASEWLTSLLAPLCEQIGLPSELLPLLILRPLSGSAANALAADLFESAGPDSFIGQTASVIMGSSDTLLYIAAVYFGAVGIKKSRHALPVAFAVMLFCIFFSCLLCRVML